MAIYYTTEATIDSTGGASLSGQTATFEISPIDPATGIHSGYNLQAANFVVGGAEESNGSGSAYTQTDTTGYYYFEDVADNGWNVDTGITKVRLKNLGQAGDNMNTIEVTVYFGSTSPAADAFYHIDLDTNPSNPPSNSIPREVCFFLDIPYSTLFTHAFYDPTNDYLTWDTISTTYNGITRSVINSPTDSNPWYRYHFSGTITDYNPDAVYALARIAFVRTDPSGTLLDPLPGAGDPVFDEYNHFFPTVVYPSTLNGFGASSDWAQMYTWFPHVEMTTFAANTNSELTNVIYMSALDLSINPIDEPWALEAEDANMCALGHLFEINANIFDPPDPRSATTELVISSADLPSGLSNRGGYQNIVVRGNPGSSYTINFIEMASLTGTDIASGTPYFTFGGRKKFKNTPSTTVFTIPSSGRRIHNFRLPSVTSTKRYDVYIEPKELTTIAEGIPSKAGDKYINQYCKATITVQATADTGLFDLTGSGATATLSRPLNNRGTTKFSGNHVTTFSTCKSSISGATKLVLTEVNNLVQPGMYVTIPMSGSGVPHKTTVTGVDGNTITLSASSTIAANAEVRFDTASAKIFPFTLTCPAGGSSGSYKNLTAISESSADYTVDSLTRPQIGSQFTGSTSGSSTTILLEAPGVQFATVGKVISGPGIQSNIDGVSEPYVKISANAGFGAKTITVEQAQTIASGTLLTVSDDPNGTTTSPEGVHLFHVHAAVTTDGGNVNSQEVATVYGYLDIEHVEADATIPVALQTMLTSVAY